MSVEGRVLCWCGYIAGEGAWEMACPPGRMPCRASLFPALGHLDRSAPAATLTGLGVSPIKAAFATPANPHLSKRKVELQAELRVSETLLPVLVGCSLACAREHVHVCLCMHVGIKLLSRQLFLKNK